MYSEEYFSQPQEDSGGFHQAGNDSSRHRLWKRLFQSRDGSDGGSDGLVVCVETESEKIESLKLLATDSGLAERIDSRICSDSSLAVDDLTNQIDFSLAFFVVHHTADVPALMAGAQKALKPGGKFLIVEPSHHASTSYCETVESAAQQAGLSVVGHPKFIRTWAVLLIKN